MDPNQLLECVNELKTIALSQQNRLSQKEISQYLSEMGLDRKQLEAVYQYLISNEITVEGYQASPMKDQFCSSADQAQPAADPARPAKYRAPSSGSSRTQQDRPQRPARTPKAKNISTASKNLTQYRREVASLPAHTREQTARLWSSYLRGDLSVRDELIQEHLTAAIQIAEKYKKHGVALEELIAEGNIGILNALQMIAENASDYLIDAVPDLAKIDTAIENEIICAMQELVRQTITARDQENAILARTNLLHEAAKYLAEENGCAAAHEELAEFTKISLEEIRDITELSDDTKRIFRSR